MSLYGAFDSTKHFEELATPLTTQSGVLSSAARRARALANLNGLPASSLTGLAAILGLAPTTPATTAIYVSGDGVNFSARVTLASFLVGTAGDNASLGLGAKLFDFPTGVYAITSASLAVGLTLAGTPTTDTPEIGLGTVVASGAVAVLGGTATFENIIEGVAVADVAGTVKLVGDYPGIGSAAPLVISAPAVFLNVADTWADVTGTALTADGTVIVNFQKLS